MSYQCVLRCGRPCKSSDIITQGKWDSVQSKSQNWSGLDKFGDVHDSTAWKNGPDGYHMHKACYITLSSSTHLEKAQQRKQKESDSAQQSSLTLCSEKCEPEGMPQSKCLRSSVGGPIHEKMKCVWCMQGEDAKHPNRSRNKLFRIGTHSAWRTFKRHTVFLEDNELRDRLTRLIESTSALSDPFANDIMYHHACWLKYTHVCPKFKAEDTMHLQGVRLSEARNLFFRHVDSVIFNEHEIRSLQSLLADYKRIVSDYGYPVGDVKSTYLKDLLICEYQDTVGFKDRTEMNKSEWVYDVRGGGDYIAAALSSLGISDEQLLRNLAPRLSEKIKETHAIPWPPRVDDLEEAEEVCGLLVQLLSWLKQPKRKNADLSPETLSLASMITSYVTGSRTSTVVNMGVTVHGMTRSKELVETLHKSGASISYADTLLVYDHWALMDVKASATCPPEIADGKPAIMIVDNDDFKVDTVSGNATGAHRTNVMFVQPESYEKKPDEEPPAKIAKKDISAQLKRACHDLTQVKQYRCPPGSKSEPPARSRIELPLNGTSLQRTRSVIHALSQTDNTQTRPPPDEHGSQHTVVPNPVATHHPVRVNPTTMRLTMSRLANQCCLTSCWS